MPQQPVDKQFLDLRAGLSTETGYLNTPDGATTDEANFRILIDGSRRRRRGLNLETGGSAYTLPITLAAAGATSAGRWNNAGGDPDKDFIVLQVGTYLHFYLDTGLTLSTQKNSFILSLELFSTTGTTADVANYPVSMASGNGRLLVCGRYIEPFYIEYTPGTDTFSLTEIDIRERDFHTIEETGVQFNTQPTTLSDAHKYNLRNRGWKQTDIDQYFTDKSKYPALGMLWHKGYARAVDGVTYISEDGVKTWNSNKMEAEPFGNATAPLGSLIINPFDTQYASETGAAGVAITNWTISGSTITVTATAHGLTHPATFTVIGQSSLYTAEYPGEPGFPEVVEDVSWSFDGTYTTASVADVNTFTFTKSPPAFFQSWDDQYLTYGSVYAGTPLENTVDNYSTNERPTVCGWFAGRAWFTGINHPALLDRIYFSKLLYLNDEDFGTCYQLNDPTAETFNQLNPDDGGVIVISDIGRAKGLLDYNGLLLLFTDEGVWEISGSRGVFTSDNYNVRKITDNECTSKHGFVDAEGIVFYTGTKGIFSIQPNERSGILFAESRSAVKVQKEWNRIPSIKQSRVKIRYDDANKQVWFLYSSDSTDTYKYEYNRALIFDIRLDSFSKMTFPSTAASYIIEVFPVKAADESETYKKLKFFVQTGTGTSLSVCDFDHEEYTDFDSTEQDAYMILAYDNIGSWAHRRQAPKVHTFMAKTETGFDATTLAPENESSLKMQARWDWSDHVNAGEWGSEIEVYRHVRAYVPSSAADPFNSGYPVVVTRNKVRGRGRSLHLKFTASAGKDAHLLGYAVQYQVGGKV
jgi:hypothetical protein